MNDSVQEIKDKLDIVSVIGEHVTLKKAGKNYMGLCPFHSEKSPSFTVSKELQIFKCFGCGEGGDIFTFIEKIENLDFYDTLKLLAQKAGIELKKENAGPKREKDTVLEVNLLAARFYHYLLLNHKKGETVKKYVTEKRKLTENTIKTFMLGAAPEDKDILTKYLLNKKGIPLQLLIKSGVTIQTQYGPLDRFRDRVIFPIFDHRGNCIALAGRILPDSKSAGKMAKYINSPETPVYQKSQSLYGIHMAKTDIKKSQIAIVVEGEFDMLTSWQNGITNTVASKGTALTKEQLTLLSRFAQKIIFSLDSDFAGDNAAIRGIQIAQDLGLSISVSINEKYKDPDEYAQNDPAGYKDSLKNSIDIWEFMLNSILPKKVSTKAQDKAAISKKVTPILALITDRIVQAHYIQKVANYLDVPEEAVGEEVQKKTNTDKPQLKENKQVEKIEKNEQEEIEERLLILALARQTAPEVTTKDEINLTKNQKLFQKIIELKTSGQKTSLWLDTLPSELKDYAQDLALIADKEEKAEEVESEYKKIIKRISLLNIKNKMHEISAELKKDEVKKDRKELGRVKKDFDELIKRRSLLEKE